MRKDKKSPGGERRVDPLRRQKAAIAWMCVAVVLLTASFFAVREIVSIYRYEDEDGTVYRIRRKGGEYVLCDRSGDVCDRNGEGYYITDMGTQLSINKESGEYAVYAKVDLEGDEQISRGQSVMLFPQMTYDMKATTDYSRVIKSIYVKNRYGEYTFYRRMIGEDPEDASDKILSSNNPADYTNTFGIDGYRTTEYDTTLFATLAVGCGYAIAMERLEDPARLGDGSVNWREYGLATEVRHRPGTDGLPEEYTYEPTCYTVTSMTGKSYTVWLGDLTVSGGGYYARFDGRDRVYVLASGTLSETVMQPIEAMVTPKITYPLNLNSYYDIENFTLYTDGQPVCTLSYIPLPERENTLYSTLPFRVDTEYMEGYFPNSDNINLMLQSLYAMTFSETVKLGPAKADLARYGLSDPRHRIEFTYNIPTSEGGGTVDNEVWISDKTEDGLYYAYAPEYDMIVSFEDSQATYLEWGDDMWYEQYYFVFNIAHLTHLEVESPRYAVTFDLDNSRSNQSQGTSSEKLMVYADGELLDYQLEEKDSNGNTVKKSAAENFRRFYEALCWASTEGLCDLTEAEMEALRRQPDSDCQLKLTATLDDGKGNTRYTVIRFYQYSERRSYMTVELLDGPDGTSDGSAAQGRFCVLRSFCDKLIADARRAAEGRPIDVDSKT